MKTTIEISDELLIQAKQIAASERCSLKHLMETALRSEIDRRLQGDGPEKRNLRWITVSEEPAQDLDVSDREAIHNWLGRSV